MGIFLTENTVKQGENPHIRKTVLTAGTKGNMVIWQSRAALLSDRAVLFASLPPRSRWR